MAVNFGRLGTVTFGRNAGIVCTPESQIFTPAGGGGTPASQGPSYGTSAASDNSNGGSIVWSNPANANSSALDFAASTLGFTAFPATSQYLKLSGYGFSIPTGATINGITVDIRRYRSGGDVGHVIYDVEVKLLKNNIVSGNNKADTTTNWPMSLATKTYGGSTDLWGTTWTPSDINSSNFGIVLSVQINVYPKYYETALVDYINIKIDYTS